MSSQSSALPSYRHPANPLDRVRAESPCVGPDAGTRTGGHAARRRAASLGSSETRFFTHTNDHAHRTAPRTGHSHATAETRDVSLTQTRNTGHLHVAARTCTHTRYWPHPTRESSAHATLATDTPHIIQRNALAISHPAMLCGVYDHTAHSPHPTSRSPRSTTRRASRAKPQRSTACTSTPHKEPWRLLSRDCPPRERTMAASVMLRQFSPAVPVCSRVHVEGHFA
jgi:hypothetical protein